MNKKTLNGKTELEIKLAIIKVNLSIRCIAQPTGNNKKQINNI